VLISTVLIVIIGIKMTPVIATAFINMEDI
jgi:hypothetical protein